MRGFYLLIVCLIGGFILTGCAGIKAYKYEADRVDQDLSRGNRGVVAGEIPSEEPERKSTRTMLGVDVTLPAPQEYKEKKVSLVEEPVRKKPVEKKVKEEPVITLTVPPMPPGAPAEEPVEKEVMERYMPEAKTYTIQKGDTLQSISMKFYGTTKKWPMIFDANKDDIKHSSKIYPGQVITIPQDIVGDSTVGVGPEEDYK